MELLKQFVTYIENHHLFSPKDKLLLAVSGGIDSVVLCELCKQAEFDFAIAHCNFQLRGEDSNRDEQFVKELAKKYGVEFFVKTFDTKLIALQQKKSIEETARDLRYEWFKEIVDRWPMADDRKPFTTANDQRSTANYILTAHHADDTIETVMMNFFRGTGIKGLRGILPKNGKVIRPLLFARRKDLEEFLQANQLQYVSDYTNFEDEYTRNFFRNKFIPSVQEYFPGADENVLKNAERFTEVEELYNQAIALHKKKLLETRGGSEIHIPVLKLKKSTPLHSIVYEIIKDFGFSSHQTNEVIALLDSDSGKYISSSSHRIIKNRNWIIIAPVNAADSQIVLIEGEGNWEFGTKNLEVKFIPNPQSLIPNSNSTAHLDAAEIKFPLLLRKWKTGDYFYPLGMKKKKKLSRFFIDNKLSKTEKENSWIIESNKRIVWVLGHRIDERFKITGKTKQGLKINISQS